LKEVEGFDLTSITKAIIDKNAVLNTG